MSDMPERIWAVENWSDGAGDGVWFDADAGYTEYLRADYAQSLIAEAYAAAAEAHARLWSEGVTSERCREAIRALTPADAIAAREARDEAMREEGRREEREKLDPWRNYQGPVPDDESIAAPVFGAGVTHALVLLGRFFGVSPITLQDGTEEHDGDVLATIWGIIREAIGDDAAYELAATIRAQEGGE